MDQVQQQAAKVLAYVSPSVQRVMVNLPAQLYNAFQSFAVCNHSLFLTLSIHIDYSIDNYSTIVFYSLN